MKYFIPDIIIILLLGACSINIPKDNSINLYDEYGNQIFYLNPITDFSFPDPTIIKDDDGWFYAFSTSSRLGNIPMIKSKDLVNWIYVGDAINETIDGQSYWAPDINRVGDKYILYASVWRGEYDTTEIIALSADNVSGPYVNHGTILSYDTLGGRTLCIDPELIISENGDLFLLCGSFLMCKLHLSSDGLSILPNSKIKYYEYPIEGFYYIYRHGYHYLFGSAGQHTDASYSVIVGRSSNLDGPYFDKNGVCLSEGYQEKIIAGNDRFYGTGHNSEIFTDGAGNDWICYHAYDYNSSTKDRYLMLSRLEWDIYGWPQLYYDTPTHINEMPIF